MILTFCKLRMFRVYTVNKDLDKIHGWLCTNTLSINLTKTNFVVFGKSNKFVIPRIYIDNHLVKLTDNVILLRVLIDNRINGKKICFQ